MGDVVAEFLGLLAGLIGVVGYTPYIRDILKGSTKPDRASWHIWALEYAALFAAQVATGGKQMLWLIGLQLVGVTTICVLSYRYGVGGFDARSMTIFAFVCSVLGLWYYTQNAILAILLLLIVEAIGVILTAKKVYLEPGSETLTTWFLIGVAGLLGVPAVGIGAEGILYVYPLALVCMSLCVIGGSVAGQQRRTRMRWERVKRLSRGY